MATRGKKAHSTLVSRVTYRPHWAASCDTGVGKRLSLESGEPPS